MAAARGPAANIVRTERVVRGEKAEHNAFAERGAEAARSALRRSRRANGEQ